MTASLRQGDALTVLRTLPDTAARCCVTSPPYWGLRDYGTGTWEGGDPSCPHRVGGQVQDNMAPGAIINGQRPGADASTCRGCGARRIDAQLGLERTPEEYVANMVAVFREVRRVLADDGTLWLNLGDSYAGYWGDATARKEGRASSADTNGWTNGFNMNAKPSFHEAFGPSGLKHKNLVGIPWRVAFALQADGWYLRSDIIWAKPNPMPESVTDRPTKSHEYLFLLAKSERYYYNADAVAEPSIHAGAVVRNNNGKNGQMGEYGATRGGFLAPEGVTVGDTRNARTVWTIPTMPYKGAHFATFPEELARRCIMAGSAPGDTVLDPFGGSGTVAQVATGNGRSALHIDLNPAYIELARQRIGPMLCTEAAVSQIATPAALCLTQNATGNLHDG